MSLTRRHLLAGLAAPAILALVPRPALAGASQVFAPMQIAIGGADPVGYFTEGRPVEGRARHALRWRGADWYFASRANRERFEADPLRHAPRFGGYCAYAAAKGFLAPTEPEAWTIHGGRLYLNSSMRSRTLWREAIEANIARAEKNWPHLLD